MQKVIDLRLIRIDICSPHVYRLVLQAAAGYKVGLGWMSSGGRLNDSRGIVAVLRAQRDVAAVRAVAAQITCAILQKLPARLCKLRNLGHHPQALPHAVLP